MRNKIAFAVRFLALVVAFCAIGQVWADTAYVNGIAWTYTVLYNGEASIGNESNYAIPRSTTGAITIPSKIGVHNVTRIASSAFLCCTNLTSVTIPDGVTSIGNRVLGL